MKEFTLTPNQAKVFQSKASIVEYGDVSGSGKTTMLLLRTLTEMQKGNNCLFFCRFPQRALKNFIKLADDFGKARFCDNMFNAYNGAKVWFMPEHDEYPNACLGLNAGFIGVDDCDAASPYEFIAHTRCKTIMHVYENGFPVLTETTLL